MSSLFADNIKDRRKKLGLTLRTVEAITDGRVSNSYLSQLENGRIVNPGPHILVELSAVYCLDLAEMFSWLGIKTETRSPPLCPTCGQVWLQYVVDVTESNDSPLRSLAAGGGDG